ncbi:type IV pilin-like G/H family protein [Pseudanabaena mucicola]|uniref:Uncharacterized protein n=1 Tax=Pseudanabaena mucicola FACHB-723 TaxID=2692860 RepID=A0ABR8A049_9CYAN|nr:type IV pilin-like G/H family protein [Pseudanabaena mucicola]MBD2189155.1 hypothetical protein [Pseudanabaena mucicola FACHB-723]
MEHPSMSGESKPKFPRKRVLQICGLATIPLGIGICFIQVPIACSCGNPAIPIVGSYVRSQQAYFIENQTFASSYAELRMGWSEPPKSVRYEYAYEVAGNRAFIYATPRDVPNDLFKLGLSKADISGVVGAVTYDKAKKTTASVVCISDQNISGKPPRPVFNNQGFTCPVGYRAR